VIQKEMYACEKRPIHAKRDMQMLKETWERACGDEYGTTLSGIVMPKRDVCTSVEKDLHIWKETCKCKIRPEREYVVTNSQQHFLTLWCKKRRMYVKRDLYICGTRPTFVQKDLRESTWWLIPNITFWIVMPKEMYVCEKRLTYV